MRVQIDSDRCDAMGACVDACPEIFGQDIDGYAVLLQAEVSDDLLESARAAEELCPAQAITLIDS